MTKEQKSIYIKGARVHNLKNIEVEIPHNRLVVITGLSGSVNRPSPSTRSSPKGAAPLRGEPLGLCPTIPGQDQQARCGCRTGIAPAIAIEQKVNTRNPRSTVGTTTELYDYLKNCSTPHRTPSRPYRDRRSVLHRGRRGAIYPLLRKAAAWPSRAAATSRSLICRPGTEYNVYGDGVCGVIPRQPFHLAKNNPLFYKPGGFLRGAGHGSTMEDRYGNWWHTATMQISKNHDMERRVGIWRAGFDEDGVLFCNQQFGDWPMAVEQEKEDPGKTGVVSLKLSESNECIVL